MRDADLELFVRESNRIEGILSNPHESDDFHAHEVFLGIATPSVADLVNFVGAIRGGPLRNRPGMDVRVGRHLPPRGGPDVERHLMALLKWAADNEVSPWNLHVEYETLHPFMDGNGRSGRALWAWQILRHGLWPNTLAMGFLHPAYYAALDAQGKRAGIPHLSRRGAHGLRRLLAGEVAELTGSAKQAMDAIGDRDIRQAERYVKVRQDRMRRTFEAMDGERVTSELPAPAKEGS